VLACGVLALAALAAPAQDRKDDKDKLALAGAWARKGGELKLEFCDKDELKISPHGDTGGFVIVCKYTVAKKGIVQVKITDFEGKDELKEKAKAVLPIGLEFSFRWKAKDNTATIDELKGKDVEHLKAHLEGDYDKQN
jgi:hypothetical protein